MIRSELVRRLGEEYPGLGQADIEKIVTMFFEAIVGQLASGGRVELRGFGAFSVRGYEPRTGRNPMTGEAVAVPCRSRLHFKAGKAILERVNRDGQRG